MLLGGALTLDNLINIVSVASPSKV